MTQPLGRRNLSIMIAMKIMNDLNVHGLLKEDASDIQLDASLDSQINIVHNALKEYIQNE